MPFSYRRFLLVAALASVVLAGCSSHTPDVPCVPKIAPLGAPSLRLRLSRIDLGDRSPSRQTSRDGWRTLGFDLDGRCTARTDATLCRRHAGAPSSFQEDGTEGIDNSFGKIMIPLAEPFFAHPSEMWSGESLLEIESDGTGMLSLVDGKGTWIRVPMVDVRADVTDGAGTLGAIVPLERWIALFRSDAAGISTQLCGGSTLDTILETMRDAADMDVSGRTGPDVDCDGISIGMTFEGAPIDTVPTAPISECRQVDAARENP